MLVFRVEDGDGGARFIRRPYSWLTAQDSAAGWTTSCLRQGILWSGCWLRICSAFPGQLHGRDNCHLPSCRAVQFHRKQHLQALGSPTPSPRASQSERDQKLASRLRPCSGCFSSDSGRRETRPISRAILTVAVTHYLLLLPLPLASSLLLASP